MSLCVFALIASEFMPVSLLTPIGSDLQVSEGMVGQSITVSGAFAVLTSLTITSLAGAMNRKTLLLALTTLMGVSGAIVAMAPDYLTFMVGRAFIGVVIGGFWSMSAAMAMRLVPISEVPKALSIFNGGNALATVIAPPLGSYLGAIVGWRGAFFVLVPIAMVTLVWQWISLPPMQGKRPSASSGNVFSVLKSRAVVFGMAGCGAFFMGQFMLFTYLRPFLERVTLVSVSTLSLLLMGIGVMGVVGTVVIGPLVKRSLFAPLISIPVLMSVMALALIPLGASLSYVTILLGLWGFFATAAPVGWWSWVARTMPDNAEAGGGLMVAVVQLSIALGSTIGGLFFDTVGYPGTFVASAGVLVFSACLTWQASRKSCRGEST